MEMLWIKPTRNPNHISTMKNPLTKALFCTIAMTLTVLSASKAAAFVTLQEDMLTLSITFHTQEIKADTVHSVMKYRIIETTFDTADVLKALAEDLGVTDNGRPGFPKGSYLVLTGKIYVKDKTGQTWDVSAYLQYSLAADVVLGRGTAPIIYVTPNTTLSLFPDFSGITYMSLVHIHFEDANHLADFTGFANTPGDTLQSDSHTDISSASGSGMLNGMPALITAHAELTTAPLMVFPGSPTPFGPGGPSSSNKLAL